VEKLMNQTASAAKWQTLLVNVNIATMNDGVSSYGEILNAALAISAGEIVWLGSESDLPAYDSEVEVIDCQQQWLTPGLIDSHTHIIYGGNRANEFEMRLQGASYEEIAASGGGIVSTVKETRRATEQQLFDAALPRLKALHSEGVTSCEVKSGYGLELDTEIKMLRVAQRLAKALPVDVLPTFLGAHAIPTEYKDDADAYIKLVCEQMLPEVAKEQLAVAVDVFCETVGFSLEQTRAVFDKARELGLAVKIHAEQLSNMGGTELAASYQALSADHIEYLDEAGVLAMKKAGMAAVLLPGAFYFLRETKLPPIELLRKHQVPMVVATDANPGSSPLCSILLMLNMACTLFRMTPLEALAGVTSHAAKALDINRSRGQIAVGMTADLALWNISQPAELAYQYGVNPLVKLYKDGQRVI
jgi:imidazolonepropionase